MLRVHQSLSTADAESYFSEALAKADYYTGSQEIAGKWIGHGTAMLGLSGPVTEQAFRRLCRNLHPGTAEQLTGKTKDYRTVGYDFNFHAPKGLSVLHALTGDDRLLRAFEASVESTLERIEADMETRVRAQGQDHNRVTGNIVCGTFTHLTARPVDDLPDPHMHIHAYVFNATRDPVEGKWKAGQFQGLKRDAMYYQGLFHLDLARRLNEMGIETERRRSVTGSGAMTWDIRGVPDSVMIRFSRRTMEIETVARRRGVTDPKAKDALGAATRNKKSIAETISDLQRHWTALLTPAELEAVRRAAGSPKDPQADLRTSAPGPEPAPNRDARDASRDADAPSPRLPWSEKDRRSAARQSADAALDHTFERLSVAAERRVLADAFARGVGRCDEQAIVDAFDGRGLLRKQLDGQWMMTTPEVLAEEAAMLRLARTGRGVCEPLGPGHRGRPGPRYEIRDPRVANSRGQKAAVEHVLSSTDRVIAIRGVAGAGKTTLMREAIAGIEQGGKTVYAFAPSADASRGTLRESGFENANTLQSLFDSPDRQHQVRGQVVWVDEGGMLSTKQGKRLLQLANDLNFRVVLTGDPMQHASVERGDAMRAMERLAGIRPAEVTEIQRQRGAYRMAVHALARGEVEKGFDTLDRMGWIVEVSDDNRHQALAEAYLDLAKRDRSAAVVSPTHAEAGKVVETIRSALKSDGRIGERDVVAPRLINLHWSEADRKDPMSYAGASSQLAVQFSRSRGKHKAGERCDVLGVEMRAPGPRDGEPERPVVVLGRRDGSKSTLDLNAAGCFTVFEKSTVPLAKGDLVRATFGGKSVCGRHRVDNGAVHEIADVSEGGSIKFANGWEVSADFAHLTHAYCTTSNAAQSKTKDAALASIGVESLGAASSAMFYVTVSRGRELAKIYTDDKAALREAITKSHQRVTATEFAMGLSVTKRLKDRATLNERLKVAGERGADFTRSRTLGEYERRRAMGGVERSRDRER